MPPLDSLVANKVCEYLLRSFAIHIGPKIYTYSYFSNFYFSQTSLEDFLLILQLITDNQARSSPSDRASFEFRTEPFTICFTMWWGRVFLPTIAICHFFTFGNFYSINSRRHWGKWNLQSQGHHLRSPLWVAVSAYSILLYWFFSLPPVSASIFSIVIKDFYKDITAGNPVLQIIIDHHFFAGIGTCIASCKGYAAPNLPIVFRVGLEGKIWMDDCNNCWSINRNGYIIHYKYSPSWVARTKSWVLGCIWISRTRQ